MATGYWEANLHGASLGYVEFPVSDRTVQTGRNFARHQLPYRDGQGGEDLGRKVYQWNLTVPLYRGMDWSGEELYPSTYLRLIAIIEDPELRGEVEYVDSEFGPFQVKILDYSMHTPADKRDGVDMQITLEELGFDASALSNISRPKVPGEAEASLFAASVDQDVDFVDVPQADKPSISLTQAWRDFQSALDAGALAADVVAERMDELYLVAEKYVNFSAKDEIQRWSIFTSTVRFLGAAEDVGNESARNENANTTLIEATLPADMSAYDIATYYHDDAGRADEVIFNNQTSNPMLYSRGAVVRLNADAKTPSKRQEQKGQRV